MDTLGMTLDSLIGKLHSMLTTFAGDIEDMIEENEEVTVDDIRELRQKIQERLDKNEEITDNQKLLTMLDLFATDKAVLEIIREDADEWIALLESIEDNIKGSSGGEITPEEEKEIKEIGKLTTEIKTLIRKD
jgi:regulator of replication initiation timing